jgi:IclR family pca regulon transcriptional regulator
MVYIARSSPNRILNTGYVLGARVQAHVTAAGVMMLALQSSSWLDAWLTSHELKAHTSRTIIDPELLRAELIKTRARGWALSEEQLELGYRGVAVPLRNHRGDLVAGLNVTMWMGNESSSDAVARVLPILRDAAYSLRNII